MLRHSALNLESRLPGQGGHAIRQIVLRQRNEVSFSFPRRPHTPATDDALDITAATACYAPASRSNRSHKRHRPRRQAWLIGLACFLCAVGYAYRAWHGSTSAHSLGLPQHPASLEADPDPSGAWLLPDVPSDQRPAIDADGIRAAFVVLVGPNTTAELTETLENLHKHVLAHRPRPVLLFTPGDVPRGETAALRAALPRAVAAAVRVIRLPDFTRMPPEFREVRIDNMAGAKDDTWIRRYPAYHNMCRRADLRTAASPTAACMCPAARWPALRGQRRRSLLCLADCGRNCEPLYIVLPTHSNSGRWNSCFSVHSVCQRGRCWASTTRRQP